MNFELHSDFKPKGSQPDAIAQLTDGVNKGYNFQTLLGVTGSGKTFSMANVIANVQKPALVIAHNKTLAAQLYSEFQEFFPKNRVEYFVSYYDYYQPESYLPSKDQYIEKDADVNEKIQQMRLAATASLMSRRDVIVVASVSCIYSVGDPASYSGMGFEVSEGLKIGRKALLTKFINIQYERNDFELMPGRFRVKGDTIDFILGYYDNIFRVEMFGDKIERITELDKTTKDPVERKNYLFVYPATHFVIPEEGVKSAIGRIRDELKDRLPKLDIMESHRLEKRTLYDIEMMEEVGYCKGIENYSMHLEGRKPGEKPFCLLDYFPDDFLMFIDESHRTIPQVHGMYHGDYSRKKNLIDYGFRLPSAFDNRPLRFDEFEKYMKNNKVIFVSATPAKYEHTISKQVVEQIIRPTGLIDPQVTIHPILGQIDHLKDKIEETIEKGDRVLVTTLTKKLAEEMSEYLANSGFKTRYLHSEVDTLERTEIIRQLRLGKFDVLVGINLLREGLDIPEVGFIGILDADKESFLRDATSLIQIIGRAARNANAHVVLYADNFTKSIKAALEETDRRRNLQVAFNKDHGITPETIIKPIKEKEVDLKDTKHIPKMEIPNVIIELESQMREAAEKLDFEKAISIRDTIKKLRVRMR
jgi:excinuclease ABC subunit B